MQELSKAPEQLPGNWHYTGDVNPQYGGIWIDLTDFAHGDTRAVRCIDLESATGFTGAVLIERGTIQSTAFLERIRQSLEDTRGEDARAILMRLRLLGSAELCDSDKLRICAALADYGCFEQYQALYDEDDNARAVQLDPDGPLMYDGWSAGFLDEDLSTYIIREFLND